MLKVLLSLTSFVLSSGMQTYLDLVTDKDYGQILDQFTNSDNTVPPKTPKGLAIIQGNSLRHDYYNH